MAFSNPAARLGYGTTALTEATDYPMTRLSHDFMLLNSLYRGSWVVQNIITTIPDDMCKRWYQLTTNISPELKDKYERQERATQTQDKVREGLYWGRLYGGAIGLIIMTGQNELDTSLDYSTILPGAYKGLYIADRWSGVTPSMELVNDLADPDFGLPEYYNITMPDGVAEIKVHHSRCVRFTGRQLPYTESLAEQWWGESEIEAIYHELVRYDNVGENIANLTFRASVDVQTTESLDVLLGSGNEEAQKRFYNVAQAQSILQHNFGTKYINAGDKLESKQYTFGGISDVYDRFQMNLAGASKTPVTKLFARSPAGMNATGESDLANYYEHIENQKETVLRPILNKLVPVMALSSWGQIPDDLDFMFPETRTQTPEQVSDIAKNKTAAILEAFNAGGIDAEAMRKELKNLSEQTGIYSSITDEMVEAGRGVWYYNMQSMNDPLAGIYGSTMLGETEEEGGNPNEQAEEELSNAE